MAYVLVIDDDPDNQQLVKTWLELMGHGVTALSSATEALTFLAGRAVPDLAVVDIVMPGLDGIQFLKEIRKNPLYKDMPAIFLTAADLDPHPDHDPQTAPAQYLTKPLTRATMTAAVSAALAPMP